ncbi:hypothetical protein AOLI_G00180950 [Acnodon oligacanthus]
MWLLQSHSESTECTVRVLLPDNREEVMEVLAPGLESHIAKDSPCLCLCVVAGGTNKDKVMHKAAKATAMKQEERKRVKD